MLSDSAAVESIVGCDFTDNTANHGAGLYLNNIFDSTTEIVNCRFYNNHAFGFGGAVANSSSHPFFRNCTFVNNRADREGGVLSNSGGDAQFVNCILWGNAPDAVYDQESVTTVSYSCIAGGWEGQGNFDADPGLTDPDTGDLHPAPGSPCIDAGDNDGVLLPEQNDDLDFNPRFTDDRGTPDTGHGVAPMVDIGCYEFQSTTFALTDPIPGLAGRLNRLRAIGAAPGATIWFIYGRKSGGTLQIPGCPDVTVGIAGPVILGSAIANNNGIARLDRHVPDAARGLNLLIQAVDQRDCTITRVLETIFE